MSYYENSRPWPAVGQNAWNDLDIDSQTVRSGSSSTVPTQGLPPPSQGPESAAFSHQLEEVDRAIDNLVKSGKMFGVPGRHGRQAHGSGPRPHSMAEFGDARGAHQSNLQNFYASQRHQSSRGSSDAEQMIQAKRRMAAQRERELRNYHQEQQYNRTVLAELSSYGGKPDRTLSPGSMSEADRRDLIARQRSALYGEGSFAETGGYVDETGTSRPGVPAAHHGSTSSLRGHSPLAYDYGRVPPAAEGAGAQDPTTGSPSAGANQRSRANSVASPRSNTGEQQQQTSVSQQVNHTSTSSPGASPINGKSGSGGASGTVAPIGTRPSTTATSAGGVGTPGPAAMNKRASTPLASPLGYGSSGTGESGPTTGGGVSSNTGSSGADGPMGVSGWGGRSGSVWGNGSKPGMGVQASVWG
ncbi:hypothetical protein CMQ_5035 [Grosmannia clavigera kw1407]|uniref:Uncharacterized protein n=1 Tax=Grosmannia clavigera (strain kw1407 / UAMH 11150) TaxID=655863 RepID=F0XK79_GROCL|nr:uncharacterized protein CMQ_5035 [Grosmannia clavigera kw1407]EFX01964.1 hypothetical protein CMQ_5035 [Grosmannia clavigera kw1407]